MRKLYDLRTMNVDNGEQTGASREHGVSGVFGAPSWPERRKCSSEIEREQFREFLNAKGARSHRHALK
jgi:hypothetical protein